MKRFLYILTTNQDHFGIHVKVMGQLDAIQKFFKLDFHFLPIHKTDSRFIKAVKTFLFECRSFLKLCTADRVFIRHNPKTPFTLLWGGFFSFFKPVYLEQNTLTSDELTYLGRHFERHLHHVLLHLLRWSRVRFIAVNGELKCHLETVFHLPDSRVLYLQNGYLAPQKPPGKVDLDTILMLKHEVQSGKKLALFIGNGYRWHGLPEIEARLAPYPDVRLVVVGPYEASSSSKQVLYLGTVSPATLSQCYGYFHFAVSAFRWDLLNIHEGSPLKTREYLCHGLPILVHYYDCAADFESLKPYIYDARTGDAPIQAIIEHTHDKKILATEARRVLSWEGLWKETVLKG